MLLEANRKCFCVLIHELLHESHHETGVDTATEKRAQWHLAHQTYSNSILEQGVETFRGRAFIILAGRSERKVPITLYAQPPGLQHQCMRGRQFHYTLE